MLILFLVYRPRSKFKWMRCFIASIRANAIGKVNDLTRQLINKLAISHVEFQLTKTHKFYFDESINYNSDIRKHDVSKMFKIYNKIHANFQRVLYYFHVVN